MNIKKPNTFPPIPPYKKLSPAQSKLLDQLRNGEYILCTRSGYRLGDRKVRDATVFAIIESGWAVVVPRVNEASRTRGIIHRTKAGFSFGQGWVSLH